MTDMVLNPRHRRSMLLLALLAVAALTPLLGETYLTKFATRIALFGMAALAVDIMVGYCGLVSFGHAAFIGIGAYAAGILTEAGIANGFIVWPAAALAGMFAAAVIGAISLRTTGIYFIMITLAFAQMIFYLFQSLRQYGGNDGFATSRNRFAGLLDINDAVSFYYLTLFVLAAIVVFSRRMMESQFGVVLTGARDNVRRLEALGIPSYRYRLTAFILSGGIAALAGAMLANLDGYVTPGLASWQLSGELLIMVILGGSGTLVGPIVGAVIYLFFAEILSDFTEHWMAILGPLLIIRVLLVRDGLYVLMARVLRTDA